VSQGIWKNEAILRNRTCWALLIVALVLGIGSSCSSIPVRRFADVRLKLIAQPQNTGPCLASLLGPPTKDCIQWQPNVDAAPTYDFSRRLFFVGAGDDYLHVLDADSGEPIAQVSTEGRVITRALFNKDGSVFFLGTDKASVLALDAFTFARVFSFTADSKINNNMIMVDKALVFTSAVGTIYSVNSETGELNWRLPQPLAAERLRLSSNSNIIVAEKKMLADAPLTLVVPHADGYISVIDAASGEVKKRVSLGISRPNGFPDIVAPMVILRNQLWVASYDLGLCAIDLTTFQIREQRNISEITQLASDGHSLYAATPNVLMSLSDAGIIKWKNNIAEISAKLAPLGYPFTHSMDSSKRLFYGTPSRLLLREKQGELIMATSYGSLGVFDKSNGQVIKILGNSVGFGPKIDWAGSDSIVAMSRRGLLMKFQFGHHGDENKEKPTAFRPL